MAYQNRDAALTHTLSDFIEFKEADEIAYKNFTVRRNEVIYNKRERATNEKKIEHAIFYDTNVLDFYLDELKAISLRVDTFTPDEINEYKYHPDRLAYHLYGSTQLDYIILLVNGIIDPKEFDFRRGYIYLPKAVDLLEFLSRVRNTEEAWITSGDQS